MGQELSGTFFIASKILLGSKDNLYPEIPCKVMNWTCGCLGCLWGLTVSHMLAVPRVALLPSVLTFQELITVWVSLRHMMVEIILLQKLDYSGSLEKCNAPGQYQNISPFFWTYKEIIQYLLKMQKETEAMAQWLKVLKTLQKDQSLASSIHIKMVHNHL